MHQCLMFFLYIPIYYEFLHYKKYVSDVFPFICNTRSYVIISQKICSFICSFWAFIIFHVIYLHVKFYYRSYVIRRDNAENKPILQNWMSFSVLPCILIVYKTNKLVNLRYCNKCNNIYMKARRRYWWRITCTLRVWNHSLIQNFWKSKNTVLFKSILRIGKIIEY